MNVDEIAAAVLAGAEKLIAKSLEPLHQRIAELEGRSVPTTEETAAEAARILLAGDGIKSLIDLEMAEHIAANPPQKGEKGDTGESGADGRDGKDGADGIGLAGAMIDRDDNLQVTLTNGEVKNLGRVAGKDGMGFDDLAVEHDGEGSITLKFSRGGVVKEFPLRFAIPTFKGYWKPGRKAEAGHVYTHKGNAWIAIKPTSDEPQRERKDEWQILAAKGNDGRDGRDLMPRPDTIELGG